MNLIVLDAGNAYELDGFNKLLLRKPYSNKTIIEQYCQLFNIKKPTIVTGFRAIELMNQYPEFNYIHNANWSYSASSYSLSLALTSSPSIVVANDLFLNEKTVAKLAKHDNCILVRKNDNRRKTSLSAVVKDNKLVEIKQGRYPGSNLELLSIFKITDKKLLEQWKKNCVKNPDLYAGDNLPISSKIAVIEITNNSNIIEINTPEDYIKSIEIL